VPRLSPLDKEVFALAVPAFATLLAEPLLVMCDAAIVGHISTVALAGLGVAASIVGLTVGLCVFLAYATTGAVARKLGAGHKAAALSEGLDGIALGVLLGAVLACAVGFGAKPLISVYGPEADVAAQAATYLRVVVVGLPAVLAMLAATGVLRGLQDTRTPLVVVVCVNCANMALNATLVFGFGLGIAGAAIGTVCSQYAGASWMSFMVVRAARREGVAWRWNPAGVLAVARTGGWLVLRTLTLQIAVVGTSLIASRLGTLPMAAHQVLGSLWGFLAYAMDAIAIAAQAIVGKRLGAGQPEVVRALLGRMLGWGVAIGVVLGGALWAANRLYLPLFSPDPEVRNLVASVLVIIALVTPVCGVVFVLDGVLIGAGDGRYLALAGVVNLAVYTPLALTVLRLHAGLAWLWLAYCGFMLARMATLGLRARGDAWMLLAD
jgi:putative MATE family efflux protein